MRVLLLANDCNPTWPSLPSVGYNACRAIADHVDVVLATHVRNRPALRESGCGRARIVYIDNEYVAAPMYRLATWLRGGHAAAWTTNIAMAYPSYLAFEWEVWKQFKSELASGGFDVVHRVTPMSPTLPSPIASWLKRYRVPFVIGPLNGGLPWPRQFTDQLKAEGEWLTYLRRLHTLLPYYRSTYRNAAAILAAFDHTIASLPRAQRHKAVNFPEIGIDPTLFHAPQSRDPNAPLSFLFAGRLVPLKLVDVAIMAFATEPQLPRHRFLIIGDGPEAGKLQSLIDRHGLQDCVRLLGRKPHAKVGELMSSADVFVFPSIKDLGAGVVVEAMACGMTCLVVDYGGPGGLINESNGVKIALTDKQQLIGQFAREMLALADDPARRQRLGQQAQHDATSLYSWNAKAAQTVQVYRNALGMQSDFPRGLGADFDGGVNTNRTAQPSDRGPALARQRRK